MKQKWIKVKIRDEIYQMYYDDVLPEIEEEYEILEYGEDNLEITEIQKTEI